MLVALAMIDVAEQVDEIGFVDEVEDVNVNEPADDNVVLLLLANVVVIVVVLCSLVFRFGSRNKLPPSFL